MKFGVSYDLFRILQLLDFQVRRNGLGLFRLAGED